jgi:hypothetical protein
VRDEDEYSTAAYNEDDDPELPAPEQGASSASMLVEADAPKLKIDEVLRFVTAEEDRRTLEKRILKTRCFGSQ